MRVGYTGRSVIIVCVVGIVSFFVGQTVIPERGAAVDQRGEAAAEAATVVNEPGVDTVEAAASTSTAAPAPVSTPAPASAPVPATSVSTPAPAPPPPPPPPPLRPASTESTIKIASAAVCTAVKDRVPQGVAVKFPKDTRALYYFTHITGARDTSSSVMHRWYREGKLVQTSILQVRSPSWRTHSRRNLTDVPNVPDIAGNWKVEVVDSQTGKVMESAAFVIE